MDRALLLCAPLLGLDHLGRSRRALIDADVDRWYEIAREEGWGWARPLAGADRRRRLAWLLLRAREFRTLFYYRLTGAGVSGLAIDLVRRVFPGPAECHLDCPDIGPGLYLAHGYSTIVAAERIGANCRIHQNVTLGWKGDWAAPVLEDGVTVFTGAVVIGAIRLGAGSTVGANAVVTKDVPAGAVVGGVPARPLRSAAQP